MYGTHVVYSRKNLLGANFRLFCQGQISTNYSSHHSRCSKFNLLILFIENFVHEFSLHMYTCKRNALDILFFPVSEHVQNNCDENLSTLSVPNDVMVYGEEMNTLVQSRSVYMNI